MKKLNRLTAIAKVFAVSFLLLTMQQILRAQGAPSPISGNIYGQPIVAINHQDGYWYVATGSAIYANKMSGPAYYSKVYTAPAGFSIASFTDIHYYNGNFRAVLLNDANNNGFVAMNTINTPGADVPANNLVQLPPAPFSSIPYTKIAGTDKDLYVLSQAIVCGIEGYLYVSHDHGLTWNQDTAGNGGSVVYDFAIDTNQNVYLIGPGFLYEQMQNGDTANLSLFSNGGGYLGNSETIFIDRENRIALRNWDGVAISLDGGATFNPSQVGTSGDPVAFTNDTMGNLLSIAVDDSGNNRIYRYTDSNTTWATADNNFNITNGTTLCCLSGCRSLMAGTNGGLFTSTDNGVTWSAGNQGILAEDIFSFITQPFGRSLCTTDLGVYYKDEADTVWHLTYSVPGYYGGLLLSNDIAGNIFVSSPAYYINSQLLAKSTDNGFTWALDTGGLSNLYNQNFYIDETGTKHLYTSPDYWEETVNVLSQPVGSLTWTSDVNGLMDGMSVAYYISAMCSDRQGYLYADLYTIDGNSIMMRRPVNGTEWAIDTAGIGLMNVSYLASTASFGIVAVCQGNSSSLLFHRSENGWVPIPLNTDTNEITSVSIDDNGVIFVAEINNTNIGVYYTSDAGNTWNGPFLPSLNMQGTPRNINTTSTMGGLVSTGDFTYALTKGNWGFVFESKSTATGIPVVSQNNNLTAFPNPSSSGLWTVKADEELIGGQIEVSDMNGRIVYRATLTSTETQINSPELASGMYILNIRNGEKLSSGLLMKQ